MKNNLKQNILVNQRGYTENIPSEYFKQANHKGKVIKIKYQSKDYPRGNKSITKEGYVYTPYGYNENDLNKKYNIIYLMHGWTMTAEHYIFKCDIITILDNMIEK